MSFPKKVVVMRINISKKWQIMFLATRMTCSFIQSDSFQRREVGGSDTPWVRPPSGLVVPCCGPEAVPVLQ